MPLLILALILILLGAAIQYWYITLGLIGLGGGVYFYVSDKNERKAIEERRIREQKAQREQRQRDRQEEEKRVEREMIATQNEYNRVKHMAEELTTEAPRKARELYSDVRSYLQQTAKLFETNAYSLFWDAAESGISSADRALQNKVFYKTRLADYNKAAPKTSPQLEALHLDFSEYDVFTTLKSDLLKLIGAAHRDHRFAMIYETRLARASALAKAAEEIRAAEEKRREEEDYYDTD